MNLCISGLMAFLAAKSRFIRQKIDDIDNDDSNTFKNAFSAKALALEETDPMVEFRICIYHYSVAELPCTYVRLVRSILWKAD